MQNQNDIFNRFLFIISCLLLILGTGCTPKLVPYPTKDLVPMGNTMSIDGIWQSDINSDFLIHFESGRAYTEKAVYKNGKLVLAKNAVIIKNITEISTLKYSCNQGARNKYSEVVTFDVPSEIEIISSSILKLHTFNNTQLNMIEKTLFFKNVSLRNKETFLKDIDAKRKQKELIENVKDINPTSNEKKSPPKRIKEKKQPINTVTDPKEPCTTEQILKMKEMGMADNQVKAACR